MNAETPDKQERQVLLSVLRQLCDAEGKMTLREWWSIIEKALGGVGPYLPFSDAILSTAEEYFITGVASSSPVYRDICRGAIALLESNCSEEQIAALWPDAYRAVAMRTAGTSPEEAVMALLVKRTETGDATG